MTTTSSLPEGGCATGGGDASIAGLLVGGGLRPFVYSRASEPFPADSRAVDNLVCWRFVHGSDDSRMPVTGAPPMDISLII